MFHCFCYLCDLQNQKKSNSRLFNYTYSKVNSEKLKIRSLKCWSLHKWLSNVIHKGKDGLFFGTIYRIVFEVFLEVFFASAYTLYEMNWNTSIDLYANIVSFIWIVILFSFWMFILIYYMYANPLSLRKSSQSRFKILFEDFKERKICILNSFVFFLQRFILILILIFGWNHGYKQAVSFFFVWIGVLAFKILLRPYQQTLVNVQEIIFEFILWVIIGIFITFKDPKSHFADSGRPNTKGIICFALISSIVILNYIFSGMLSWKTWRNKERIKKLKKVKSKKVTNITSKPIKGKDFSCCYY